MVVCACMYLHIHVQYIQNTCIMHVRSYKISCIYGCGFTYIYTCMSMYAYTHSLAHIQLATDTTIYVGFHHHRDVVNQLHILKCRDHAGVILRPTSGEASEEESKQWPNKQLKLGEELCSD